LVTPGKGPRTTKEENFAEIPALCIMATGDNGTAVLADWMVPPRT